jgi:hypothetical protein
VWANGHLARHDWFNGNGTWYESKVFTVSGELLRIDLYSPQTHKAGPDRVNIYERRGPGKYVPIYTAPETHWEYTTADGVETQTKFVGELVVERRRFSADEAEGERRPLSVEQLVPEVVGLATVEQWDWSSPDRVIVQRHDGRDVYLLDCSGLAPIDDLVDPDCPPPRPVRDSVDWPANYEILEPYEETEEERYEDHARDG